MTQPSDRSEPPATTAVRPSRARRRPEGRHLPSSLQELYSEARARPADLLRYLEQRDLFITSEEDQRLAQGLVGSHDLDLNKTRLLAQEVANTYDGRFVA